jgi:uncharacterized cupin superfamily protein
MEHSESLQTQATETNPSTPETASEMGSDSGFSSQGVRTDYFVAGNRSVFKHFHELLDMINFEDSLGSLAADHV